MWLCSCFCSSPVLAPALILICYLIVPTSFVLVLDLFVYVYPAVSLHCCKVLSCVFYCYVQVFFFLACVLIYEL